MPETINLPEALDMSALTEQQRLAFFGALFAVAAADDRIDEVESDLILESLDMNGLSEVARERALALSIAPPSLQTCLDLFKDANEEIRLGLMLNLVDVVLADDEIEPGEPMTIEQARVALGVTPEQVEGMHAFAYKVRRETASKQLALRRPMACPETLRS
jgi:uncharacterized tellurite resistance protein B-like protein